MMSKEKKIIPELRFPEFEKDRNWEEVPLGQLCQVITKGTTPTTLGFNYTDGGVIFIKIESIENGRILLTLKSRCAEKYIMWLSRNSCGIILQSLPVPRMVNCLKH